ncbi:MAG: twin-arginine translocase TatA/TatE family subunit [Proteobacteria bacterium]|nr:MAG: twin-arginine translocase TatA/TatE family subunit [Pseudomonadota bacterium]
MNLGAFEIVVIVVIALVFFGPSKLPGLGKSVGEAIRGFKKGMNDLQSGMDETDAKANERKTVRDVKDTDHTQS